MHQRTLVTCHPCGGKRLEAKMFKCVLIYLWLYIGIYCAIEAGDADEHVHIKLHMPKSGVRKGVHHHHHIRHKKNPPPFVPPPHGHASSGLGTGPGTHSHVYHESPQNYLTATGGGGGVGGGQHNYHHMKKQQQSLSATAVTHLQPIGGGHYQDLIDTEFYTNEEDEPTTTAEAANSGLSTIAASGGGGGGHDTTNGDLMLKEYLTANFAAFPQPHTFEAEIMSPQTTNAELAYHQHSQRAVRDPNHHHYSTRPHSAQLNNNYHHSYYDGDVVATQHEVEDEDNEILGRTTYPLEDTSQWTPQQHSNIKPHRGLSTVKALKNEHLLKYIMQQEQQQQQPRPAFPYQQPEITNAAVMAATASKYRGDDKLHPTTTRHHGDERDDDIMEAMKAYEDMDVSSKYGEGGSRGGGLGIKALTVDDIWSQLQRTYLNKYTPQAQSVRAEGGGEILSSTASKKQKRNSQKLKTRQQHQQHSVRAATAATFPAIRNLNYENNYYSQEQPVKQATFYDSHHHQQHKPSYSSSYRTDFKPFSSLGLTASSSLSSSPSDLDGDLYETRATTRPYHKFNTASVLDSPVEDESSDNSDDVDDDTVTLYHHSDSNDDDKQQPGEDISSEETVFSPTHKKYGNNRSHRHSHASVSYGHANLNNPSFNYHDLYASYSTPIAATIATHTLPAVVSTYHPTSAYSGQQGASAAAAASSTGNDVNHESISYQWREQQHYPASLYQGYHTSSAAAAAAASSSTSQQQNHKRPQHQKLPQYQTQSTNVLRLPKATAASPTTSSSSLSLQQYHPLGSSPASSSSSPAFGENEFTTVVKHSGGQQQQQQQHQQQQRYKKRKNRLKSKRNRIVVT